MGRNGKQQKAQGRKGRGGGPQQRKGQVRGKGSGVRGQGVYSISSLAARVAKMIPKGSFAKAGARLGRMAGQGLANITGVGDYVFNDIVHTPSLPSRNTTTAQRISNVEYITDITSEGGPGFNVKELSINPFEGGVFPWMHKLGTLYTKYKMVQLVFEYRSNTSDYAASGPLGTIIMAPVYNVDAPAFSSKQQMEGATHAVSAKPSNSIMCGVECSPKDDSMKWRWVRGIGQEATNLTDFCKFSYATYGLPVAAGNQQSLGELWVHYTVELLEPIITTENLSEGGVYSSMITWNSTAGRLGLGVAGIGGDGFTQQAPRQEFDADVPYIPTLTNFVGRPTVPYFTSVETGSAWNWWIGRPGIYLVTAMVSAQAATVPNGLGPMYQAAVSYGNGTVTAVGTVNIPNTTTSEGNVCQWIVKVNAQDVRLTFSVSPTFTNLAAVVPDGNTIGRYSGMVRVVAL